MTPCRAVKNSARMYPFPFKGTMSHKFNCQFCRLWVNIGINSVTIRIIHSVLKKKPFQPRCHKTDTLQKCAALFMFLLHVQLCIVQYCIPPCVFAVFCKKHRVVNCRFKISVHLNCVFPFIFIRNQTKICFSISLKNMIFLLLWSFYNITLNFYWYFLKVIEGF